MDYGDGEAYIDLTATGLDMNVQCSGQDAFGRAESADLRGLLLPMCRVATGRCVVGRGLASPAWQNAANKKKTMAMHHGSVHRAACCACGHGHERAMFAYWAGEG